MPRPSKPPASAPAEAPLPVPPPSEAARLEIEALRAMLPPLDDEAPSERPAVPEDPDDCPID